MRGRLRSPLSGDEVFRRPFRSKRNAAVRYGGKEVGGIRGIEGQTGLEDQLGVRSGRGLGGGRLVLRTAGACEQAGTER